MTTVYYNFQEIDIDKKGAKCSDKINLPNVGQPLTNIQLNDVNYSASGIYVTGSDSNNDTPTYFVVECLEDVFNLYSNKIYIVFPLTVDPDTNNHKLSDIDNIIDPSSSNATVNLNKYVSKEGQGRCVVPSSRTFPLTITLDSKSAILIKQYAGKTFYTLGNINGISIDKNPDANSNSALIHKDLDWIMSCELLTEGGETEKSQVDLDSTSTIISLFMMTILISTVTYSSGPILYNQLKMNELATVVLEKNHYSINLYWKIHLFIVAILCFGQSIKANNSFFLFIAIALVLSYFSGTNAMTKVIGVGNSDKTDIDRVNDPNQSDFQVFYEVFKSCATTGGYILRICTFILLLLTLSGMIVSIAMGNSIAFVSILIFYFILVILLPIFILLTYVKN